MIDYNRLLPGVTGILRVKNDAKYILSCVDSCIDALDELVVVYNDCTDESPSIIEQARQMHPDKIKVYPYEHHIMSLNLSAEEYDYVRSLSDDDPRLLCNYYNFALSKVSHRYAIKIDADQFYYSDRLRSWCDWYRNIDQTKFSISVLLGCCVFAGMKLNTILNRRENKTIPLTPRRYPSFLVRSYESFLKFCVAKHDANIMVSGVNVVDIDGRNIVPLGYMNKILNILPPFNGIGDHVFFKMSDRCYYKRFLCDEYTKYRSEKFTVIEQFVSPGLYLPGGFLWFHLNMSRPDIKQKVESVYRENKERFIDVEDLIEMDYYQLDSKIPDDMFGRDARSFFQFSYSMFKRTIAESVSMLAECSTK